MTLFNDVFTQDAFGFVSLTAAVQELPYIESRLGDLALFDGIVEGVETDTVVIDISEGQIQIMTTRERGAPPERAKKNLKNTSRAVLIPHLQAEDRVKASSLFGKRKVGTNVLESVADKVNERFTWMMSNMLAPTREIHRLNALRGILLDGDGSVIENFFTLFGVSQQVFNYPLGTPTTPIRETTHQAMRLIRNTLRGVPFTGIRAICGENFFDNFVQHPTVRDTFLNWEAASELRQNLAATDKPVPFPFAGVTWEEYRGMDNLATADLGKVDDDEAIMFPVGVPGMYRTYYAPADFIETVGTLGQPFYAKVAPDFKYNEHIDQLVESNPLFINTRPRAVLKITQT